MLPDGSVTGWNSVDEDIVPVRSSQAKAPVASSVGPAQDMTHSQASDIVLKNATTVNSSSMRLSAFLGVALVLGGIGFHFGFGTLLGQITGDTGIVATENAGLDQASSSATSENTVDIPLPFGNETPIAAQSETITSSQSSAVSVTTTEHSGDTATVSIGTALQKSPEPRFTSQIPTNPYTVSTGVHRQAVMQEIAKSAKASQNLHSGAPLQTHTPKSVSETGPAGVLLLLLPGMFAVALVYRKITVA